MVLIFVVSVPVVGSVTAIDWMRSLPAAMRGRYFSFCALLPLRSSVPMLYIWPCTAPELPPERLISSMITVAAVRPRPGAAVLLGNHRGQPAGLHQRIDELLRVGLLLVDLAEVLVGELAAQVAHGVADLLMLSASFSMDRLLS